MCTGRFAVKCEAGPLSQRQWFSTGNEKYYLQDGGAGGGGVSLPRLKEFVYLGLLIISDDRIEQKIV